MKARLTSLDGLVQEAPPTLVHHVHVRLVINQRGRNALQFARQCEVQGQVAVVVQLVQLGRELKGRGGVYRCVFTCLFHGTGGKG